MPFNYTKPLFSIFLLFAVSVYFFLPGSDVEVSQSNLRGGDQITVDGGIVIPPLGLGPWLSDKSKVSHAVSYALKSGYRHIDAAAIYGNEKQVGAGIASSGLNRSSIWITSKLWNDHHRPSLVRPAIEKTLKDLRVKYLDLYLMHWPVAFNPTHGPLLDKSVTIAETWSAMEDLVRANLTRYIGISNFAKKDVVNLLEAAKIKPYAHEFETHPYLQQQAFVDYHASIGIKVIAYSPLANTNPTYKSKIRPILDDPFWIEVAAKKNVSVAQAVLGWGLARRTVIIPKSVTEGFIAENGGALGVGFSGEEIRIVEGQDKRARMNDPSKSWGVRLFEDLDGSGNGGEEEAEL